jgi:hypothetical protein
MAGDSVRSIASYIKGALFGVACYILLCLALFFTAFMIAFGNETSWSGWVLHTIELFFVAANSLWGIPASLILGALLIGKT